MTKPTREEVRGLLSEFGTLHEGGGDLWTLLVEAAPRDTRVHVSWSDGVGVAPTWWALWHDEDRRIRSYPEPLCGGLDLPLDLAAIRSKLEELSR